LLFLVNQFAISTKNLIVLISIAEIV